MTRCSACLNVLNMPGQSHVLDVEYRFSGESMFNPGMSAWCSLSEDDLCFRIALGRAYVETHLGCVFYEVDR